MTPTDCYHIITAKLDNAGALRVGKCPGQKEGTVEHAVYSATQKLLGIGSRLSVVTDLKNLT